MLALHTECLTRRNLRRLLDLSKGARGLVPGRLRALTSLGEFGHFSQRVTLQGLTLLHRVVELLLDLVDPGLELLTSSLLLDGPPLGFAQGLFQGLDLGRCSYLYQDTSVNI